MVFVTVLAPAGSDASPLDGIGGATSDTIDSLPASMGDIARITGTLPNGNLSPPRSKMWQITPSLGIEEIFTDNARAGSGPKNSDLVTATTPAISIDGKTRNTQLRLDGSYTYDKYAVTPGLDGGLYSLDGNAVADLWKKTMFIDWRSAINLQPINPQGAHAAIDRTLSSNQTEVINNSVSPYLRRDFGNFASGELRYRLSTADFSNVGSKTPTASAATVAAPMNTITNEASYSLSSGTTFSRLSWSLDGDENKTTGGTTTPTTQFSNILNTEFRLIREVGVTGQVGYESMSSAGATEQPTTASSQTSGVIWRIGPRLTPGPRTTATVEYGKRYNGNYWSADLEYKITSKSALTFTHDVEVTTQQRQINSNLNNLVNSTDGTLVNQMTNRYSNSNQMFFNFTNQVYTQETSRLTLSGQQGRTNFIVSGQFAQRKIGTVDISQQGASQPKIISFDASLSRKLSPLSDATFKCDMTRSLDKSNPDNYTSVQFNLGYDRELSKFLHGTISYIYSLQENQSTPSIRENVFLIGLKRKL